MIDFLRGPVVHLESEYVVLDVQGVGYRVFCPNPYAFAKVEGPVTIYIHYQTREDATLLFGFPTREEQKLFRKLIEVSGIGPRVALGILTGGTPDQLISAIYQENITFLTKLPGIGKKTAQRMILDLKDKLDGLSMASMQTGLFAVPTEEATDGLAWQEARDALKGLGYTESELDRVWLALKKEGAETGTVDVLMKKALGLLYIAK
ncbi:MULTISPECIES: Holliday junction branch migration protein RuvA [Paenibacillus]|jgi:Holliday junction DNA helicase RuvA|uniref:Holliday junction branch migration complex subunit RuvA n=1 Tax=Paenibacillus odorifer TaxID=189426 RepID=A0A1R0WRJ9_9BACL|nr:MULTISPECIES: Holliday junction branch migration protein RuvA [Paenibacillus]AIQ76112.1 ATP-dependent DNA helicase RuvA [Paenibacillus odorifer]AWV35408.1 Holliday junction branch migration protein RuvA [Paenibacillus odorifer]ETT67300.1 Holliday junction DNA helicase RuvA [Paenibacillus sp. FSL H8-237]MEC0133766.1 Holliday junction branch migration protein RuvA [Paenibacillus odorifer]MEC0221592.1 Holliday junction branch migration protein RuvA [Paenibacillus odorifer]